MLGWAEDRKINLMHIQTGRPMQNGHVECFPGRLRDRLTGSKPLSTCATPPCYDAELYSQSNQNRRDSSYRWLRETGQVNTSQRRIEQLRSRGNRGPESRWWFFWNLEGIYDLPGTAIDGLGRVNAI